jgi:hypothetical protein
MHGDVIPLDFIPELKLAPHKLSIEILDPQESNLPDV